MPVSQYFAYLEVGDAASGLPATPSPLWSLYERMRDEGEVLAMRKVSSRGEIYPVFRELFQRRQSPRVAS